MLSSAEERFAVLFEGTHLALLAYAVRRVADAADAADVVAETFLVAWRRLDDVPTGEGARPWLFGWLAGFWPTITAVSAVATSWPIGCVRPCRTSRFTLLGRGRTWRRRWVG